jgi:hypothetical protein
VKRFYKYLFIFSAFILLAGCTPYGILYTHTKMPLDTNMSQTPVSGSNGQSDIKHIRFYVDVMWDSNAIGDIAKKHGIEEIYYADIERLSVLGIWNQYTVYVYGK